MDNIKCPKCGSTQITTDKKGFSGKKAVAGAVLTGGIGLLAGTIGSNKIVITCLSCGKQFRPGEDYDNAQIKKEQVKKAGQITITSKSGITFAILVSLPFIYWSGECLVDVFTTKSDFSRILWMFCFAILLMIPITLLLGIRRGLKKKNNVTEELNPQQKSVLEIPQMTKEEIASVLEEQRQKIKNARGES